MIFNIMEYFYYFLFDCFVVCYVYAGFFFFVLKDFGGLIDYIVVEYILDFFGGFYEVII